MSIFMKAGLIVLLIFLLILLGLGVFLVTATKMFYDEADRLD